MWLFTSFGFFSVVRKTDQDELTIRARTQGDLLRLQRSYLPRLGAPVGHAGTDYPWRATCSPDDLAQAMSRIVADLDYANFKDEVAITLGPARAKRYGKVWSALFGMDDDLPEPAPEGWEGLPWGEKTAPGKAIAFGGVIVAPDGRLLLREVAGHYDGYAWTFAKGRPEPGESPRAAALREVREETGVAARILAPIPGTFDGSTTRNLYFLMLADPRAVDLDFRCRETARLRWALPDEARSLFASTTNVAGRKRDLALLDAAASLLSEPLPLARPIARREDWRTRPMPARRTSVPLARRLGHRAFAQVIRGLVPVAMEDRWFSWFEDGVLHFHRSWTGFELFRMHWAFDGEHWQVVRTEASQHDGQWSCADPAELLDTANGLIDELIEFGEDPPVDGLAQAMLLATRPDYLGSPSVVDALVQRFLETAIGFLTGQAPREPMLEAARAIRSAMTDDPAFTRMPWHSREQLGEALVRDMALDDRALANADLGDVVDQAFAAVLACAHRMLEAFEADDRAQWNPHALEQLNSLHHFVTSALLGTTSVTHPDMTLDDFAWQPVR